MTRKESVINAAIVTALGVAGMVTYHHLRQYGPAMQDRITEELALRIGYDQLKQTGTLNLFCLQIPGRLRSSNFLSELLAEPGTRWEEVYRYQESLSPEGGYTNYMQIKPAYQKQLGGLFLLREYGEKTCG